MNFRKEQRYYQTSRYEDMSPTGQLKLIRQPDGDIIVSIVGTGGVRTEVEFCASGGRSYKTLLALKNLMVSMAQDNMESRFFTAPEDCAEQKEIASWEVKQPLETKEQQMADEKVVTNVWHKDHPERNKEYKGLTVEQAVLEFVKTDGLNDGETTNVMTERDGCVRELTVKAELEYTVHGLRGGDL